MTMSRSRVSTAGLLVGLAIVVAVGGLGYRNTTALYETQRWAAHTHEVIESLDEMQIAMNDAVAQRRGFALTGDEAQQRSYFEAVARVGRYRAALEQLTEDNSRQQERFGRARSLVAARLAQLDAGERVRGTLDFDVRREAGLTTDGNAQSERIQSLIDEMKREERGLLAQRKRTARSHLQLVQRAMVFGVSVSIGVLLLAFLLLRRQVAMRAALASENARLFENARSHSDDLREANRQMVSATIRAQELTDEAEAAKALTEKSEHELRAVAELREMFIGVVGHDLRTPLAAIGMAAAVMLRHHHLSQPDEEAVGRIIRSGQRMARMVSQLLDLTRARLGGGFPLEPKPIDLRDVCRNVVEELAAPIQLEIEGDVTGFWDPDRLAEVLSNLAGNAVEHATPGTPLVLRAHAESAEVVVEISNQGEPIPPDVLPFIFEPFRRAKQLERSPSGNLGLGLYIARQIVLSHHGTLEARSAAGTTTFAMRLPRCVPLDGPAAPKRTPGQYSQH